MEYPPKVIHPEGELPEFKKNALSEVIEVETYAGKLHIEWDHDAAVTPMGQLRIPLKMNTDSGER